jgi:6-phosphogluconolactonase
VKAYVYRAASAEYFKDNDSENAERERIRKLLTPEQLKTSDGLLTKWRNAGSGRMPWSDVGLSPLNEVGKVQPALAIAGSPLASPGQLVFVSNCQSQSISAYHTDLKTGELVPQLGSPFASEAVLPAPEPGTAPRSIAVAPSGRFVYATNYLSGHISGYMVNRETGALTQIANSSVPTGSNPSSIAVDPTGRFIYVANRGSGDVSAYRIDKANGTLSPIPGSPYPVASAPVSLAVEPAGKFLYIADSGISAYQIDNSTGRLTPVPGSPFAPGSEPQFLVVAPGGKFVYAVGGDNEVSGFSIERSSGVLGRVPGLPFHFENFSPGLLAIDPIGRYMYAAGMGQEGIWAFRLDPTTGGIATIAGSPFVTPYGPYSIAVDPLARLLYGSWVHGLGSFSIDGTTGALTAVPQRDSDDSDPCAIATLAEH